MQKIINQNLDLMLLIHIKFTDNSKFKNIHYHRTEHANTIQDETRKEIKSEIKNYKVLLILFIKNYLKVCQ